MVVGSTDKERVFDTRQVLRRLVRRSAPISISTLPDVADDGRQPLGSVV